MEGYNNIPNNQPTAPEKPKKKFNPIVLVALILAYTIIVSGSTVLIYQNFFEGKESTSASEKEEKSSKKSKNKTKSDKDDDNDTDDDYEDSDDDFEGKISGGKTGTVNLNEKFTVDEMFEVTLLDAEWLDEVKPSDTSDYYSYCEDKEDETYFVVHAKIKNISGIEIDPDYNIYCSLNVNGKYSVDGNVAVEGNEHTNFYGTLKPLQEGTAVFYISVSDEMCDVCESAEMTMKFVNNEDAVDTYSREDENYDTFTFNFDNTDEEESETETTKADNAKENS